MAARQRNLLTVAILVWCGACDGSPAPVPPVLAQLPAFTLVRHDGQKFSDADLVGKVSIVSFVFTRCPTICPLITTRSKALQRQLQRRAQDSGVTTQLVSISVDPEFDSPEVLRSFRRRSGVADGGKPAWWHVTGDSAVVQELVVKGFRTALGEPTTTPVGDAERFDILHSSHFVLVGPQGRIRGYFRSDPEGLEELIASVGVLQNAP